MNILPKISPKISRGLALMATTGLMALSAPLSAQDQRFVTIGTGGVTGVYYPTGGAICRLVNNDRATHGIRCSVESTGGSVYNTRTIRAGELDFGVVQSDVQGAALAGTGAFEEDGAYGDLRALFSLHAEPMHLMMRADKAADTPEGLKGLKVNIGNPGSGTRVLADKLMEYHGLKLEDFALAAELKSSEQAAALCDGKLDAAIWAAGLPNGSSQEATSTCDIKMMPLATDGVKKLLGDNPAYAAAVIPGGMYPGNDADIPSWGPKATIVTSAQTPDDVVYALVKGVFDNFDDFKGLHPAFADLEAKSLITEGLTAELHPGAVKYYKEKGWM